MDGASSFDDYRMPDELWEQMEPFLPKYPESTKGGRPRADLRSVADAIFLSECGDQVFARLIEHIFQNGAIELAPHSRDKVGAW